MSGKKKAAAPAPVQMDIVTAIEHPLVFRPLFKDIRTWHFWIVFWTGLFGLAFKNEADRVLWEAFTGLPETLPRMASEAFVICPRRDGKSFMMHVLAIYMAVFRDWRPYLAPGERGWVFIVAVDKAQASIIKNLISSTLHLTPTFRKMIQRETAESIDLKNGISIAVKSASFRAVRGYCLVCGILDELAFFRSEDSSSPDRELLAALRPALATVPGSLLIGISTPYSRSGVLYEMWRTYYGQPGGPLVWKVPSGMRMNPTIDPALIQRAIREDPEAARSEWLAEWRQDIEAFISQELVQSVIIPGRFELPRLKGVQYYGFADASSGRQDSFAVALAHQEKNGRVVLDVLRERRPPFQPKGVIEEFSDLLKSYGVAEVVADKYAVGYVEESFRLCGINLSPSERTSSEIFLEVLPLITNGTAELLDNKRLAAQLAGLERRTRSGGKDVVCHYAGGHDDCAVAASGALVLASKNEAAGPAIGTIARSVFPDDYNDERELAFGLRRKAGPPMDGYADWKKRNPL